YIMFNIPQTVIELILVLNYLFVLFIIITSKREVFKNVFYMMFVATGFADVTSILVNCIFRINSDLQFGRKSRSFTLAVMVIHGVAFISHMVGNLIITINRFSVLCLKKDRFWSRKNVRIIICLQYVCAFAAIAPAIGVDMLYVKNSDGSYTILGISKQDDLINQFTYIGAAVLYAVIGFILNVKVLVYLHGMLKLSNSARMIGHEKGMVICTLLVFGSTMLMCIQQTLRGIAILTENTEIFNSMTLQVGDVYLK
uniref:Serpentine receptor class gamma n=1 Tax=Haemonchus contortus TaxID=6289 RepID=A0A7I4YSE9_HAECO